MTSAVDTSVLIDLLADDPLYAKTSQALLEKTRDEGKLVVSEIVYAEISPLFHAQEDLDAILEELGASLIPSNREVAFLAGQKWAQYRKAGGPRTRLLADFLIGAHAVLNADRLLTRDRGFYRTYFPDLELLGE